MTIPERVIAIACLSLATLLTTFLPFILFPSGRKIPRTVTYLGKMLPAAVLAMLVVYCFRGYASYSSATVIASLAGSAVTVILYFMRRTMLLPIAGGTAVYMVLIHLL